MRPRRLTTPSATWLRLLRGLVAALVLALVPVPATAGESGVVDAVELVAGLHAATMPPSAEAPPLRAGDAASQRHSAGADDAPPGHEHRGRRDASPNAPRAPLFLLHCALLR